jgi:UDP-N-acetylmuramoyl-L-alanyl-D-glutamate--2,6-diaminopimelate ligase
MNPKRIVRKVLPEQGIKVAEETYRKSRIIVTQARYGFPARGARVIAVTGTNGKTTTAVLINSVLKAGGYRTALFTTAVVEMDGVSTSNKSHRTVPLTNELVRFFKTAKAKQVNFIILETTSQALDQHKLMGIPVEIAVMTNLTQDHLDYHGTMDDYAAAKARLFNVYASPRYCILNRDDAWFNFFKQESVGTIRTYGKAATSDVRITDIASQPQGNSFSLHGEQIYKLQTKLSGLFNVYNAAAAAAVGEMLNIPGPEIAQGLADVVVPGRMEAIREGQDFEVIVDYAHTPDALENVLSTLKNGRKGRVAIVFGATGDRDAAKRPVMGEIVATLADRIYLTDDETYSEDPALIRDAVYEGIKHLDGEGKTTIIDDRLKAIAQAFEEARKGDVVLLAGIGHQDYRAMGGENIEWDEREVARRLLRKTVPSRLQK